MKINSPFQHFDSVAASGELLTGTLELYRARTVSVSVRCTFNGSATSGATVNVYTSPDGVNFDTEPFTSGSITLSAGSTCQKTLILNVPEEGVFQIGIENEDSSYTLTAVDVWFTINRYLFTGQKMSKEELEREMSPQE